jgi:hypothetical protein
MINNQQMQMQQQQQQQNGHDNSLGSPSPVNGFGANRTQNSISPASSAPGNAANGHFNPLHGPTASTIFNSGSNNPLTMYLAATQQQNAQALAEQQQNDLSGSNSHFASQQSQQVPSSFLNHHAPSPSQQLTSSQQAFYSSPNEVTNSSSSGRKNSNGLDNGAQPSSTSNSYFGHNSHQSMNLTGLNGAPLNGTSGHGSSSLGFSSQNGGVHNSTANTNGTSSGSRGANSLGGNQHSRTVSLPAFSLQQAQFNQQQQLQQHGNFVGLGGGLVGGAFSSGLGAYGLGMSESNGAGGLPGWAEEEVA